MIPIDQIKVYNFASNPNPQEYYHVLKTNVTAGIHRYKGDLGAGIGKSLPSRFLKRYTLLMETEHKRNSTSVPAEINCA